MRISGLRKIKSFLNSVVEKEGYFIYIAPLLNEHYRRYIELIHENFDTSKGIIEILTDEDILRATVLKIDVRTEIMVDTNLYISRLGSNTIELENELLKFVVEKGINYTFLIGESELIKEFEIKPKNKLNE